MDNNVIGGILRAVVPASIAYLIGKGILPVADYGSVVTAFIALATAAWSVKTNTK